MDERKQLEQIHERLKIMFPDEETKLEALVTSLGMCAIFTKYIHEAVFPFVTIDNLPSSILYAVSVTAANMYALTSLTHNTEFEIKKFPLLEGLSNEQHEEAMRQKMIEVIEYLYAYIKGDEKV